MHQPRPTHLQRGHDAEAAALAFLESHDLLLLEPNYNCRCGELDLVMLDGDELVFVEVRYRQSFNFGGALDSITKDKKRKLKLAAEHFLQKHRKLDYEHCRFDVLALSGQAPDWRINWISDAFQ